jgi:hypothetical protein
MILPAAGSTSLLIMRTEVVFRQPLGPTSVQPP